MCYTTPPSRTRPGLHLMLPPISPSPTSSSSRGSPVLVPFAPFGATNYSPFRSAGLRPPSPFGGPVLFSPHQQASGYRWCRARRCLGSRILWFMVAFLGLLIWWGRGGGRGDWQMVRVKSSDSKTAKFGSEVTKDLQFFPAGNPKIHVSTSAKLRLYLH
jgi:hypothetical protein